MIHNTITTARLLLLSSAGRIPFTHCHLISLSSFFNITLPSTSRCCMCCLQCVYFCTSAYVPCAKPTSYFLIRFFHVNTVDGVTTKIIIYTSSSSSSLSDDRFKAASKTIPPHIPIHNFLLQMRVSSSVLKVIQWLLTSSSLSSRHFYLPFYLSSNNLF